jgi:hypothetical protein
MLQHNFKQFKVTAPTLDYDPKYMINLKFSNRNKAEGTKTCGPYTHTHTNKQGKTT